MENMIEKGSLKAAPGLSQEPMDPLTGIVTNCLRLNIREKPSKTAKAICVVDAFCELLIDPNESVDGWFKVYTEAGCEGYCMKEFVAVKEQVEQDG